MGLITEDINPASVDIDLKPTQDILRIINEEDKKIALAVEKEIPNITKAVDLIVERLRRGGRLFYIGAGTSGRIGVLDAVECPPTFGTDPELVQGVIAGGYRACYKSVEAAEDEPTKGADDLWKKGIAERDVLVAVAASGRTPYVLGALDFARNLKIKTIAVTCNPGSEMARRADVAISVVVGPEVITGSTRMKAGTAQKMVLNMLSTATMIKLGNVYSNLMINVQMRNQKLVERGKRILMSALNISSEKADRVLKAAGYDLKAAVVMYEAGVAKDQAQKLLRQTNYSVREALEQAGNKSS